MIILFNLNKYIGGGETILIQFARYLKREKIEYSILSQKENSFIGEVAQKEDLSLIDWKFNDDSLVYVSENKIINLRKYLCSFLPNKKINIFTFCFRDLYNSIILFSEFDNNIYISHGFYHPEDDLYLTSFFGGKRRNVYNINLCKELHNGSAAIFPNINAVNAIFKGETKFTHFYKEGSNIFPLIVDRPSTNFRYGIDEEKNAIICISRFVSFKIGAIMGIVKYVKRNPKYHLNLIGYGTYGFVIKIYILLYKLKNVSLHGRVSPENLFQIISKCNVGYAQGASMLEISKYGIPTIIAPYSRLLDIFNGNFKCLGVYQLKENFEYGDRYFHPNDDSFIDIDAAFRLISQNKEQIQSNYGKIRKHFPDNVFNNIIKYINSSTIRISQLAKEVKKISAFRSICRNIYLKIFNSKLMILSYIFIN